MRRIAVLGYYNKNNFGDDLFAQAFRECVFDSDSYSLELFNLKDILNLDLTEFECVVIGGGDIVNKYYLNDAVLCKLASTSVETPVIFYSFGLSFPQLISQGILDVADFYFPRNKKDTELLQYRFGDSFVQYTPDMTFLLADQIVETPPGPSRPDNERFKIGMCLPFPWFADDYNTGKSTPLLDQLIQLVIQLIPYGDVFFLPFDTSSNKMNSDIILHNIVKSKLPPEFNDKVFFVSGDNSNRLDKMNEYFNNLDVVFCSRFHSVIMSVMSCTPFISLYASKKLENIVNDMNGLSSQFVPLSTNESGAPVSLGDISEIVELFLSTRSKKAEIAAACKAIKIRDYAQATAAKNALLNVITKKQIRASPPQYLSSADTICRTDTIVKSVVTFALKRFGTLSPRNVDKIMRDNESLSNILPKTAIAPFTQKTLTEEILWTITGDPHGPYYYGLYDTVLTRKFIPQIKWIISDYNTRFKFKVSSPNITVVNKNFYEIHRSGWQYALNNLLSSTNLLSSSNSIIIDTYVDKTFHWNRDFYLSKKIIPYISPWIGFIHHTFSDYNNQFNCTELFKTDTFLTSLECCQGLVVMTEYLQKQIISALERVGLSHIPVHVVYHPTEFVTKTFDPNAFLEGTDKRLVQIGNWLRNVFSIYRLDIPKNSFVTQKAILRNRNSDSYFLPDGFLENAFAADSNASTTQLSMCRIAFSNMHVKGLFQVIQSMENSVIQIDHLVDDQYDDLLSSSVVFIDLVDASAVNTLIECIARNTPIMINPIKPVVEILGENYPLYFSSYFEASKLLENTDAMLSAHQYLKAMDKTRFKAQTFVDCLEQILTNIN